MRTEFAAGARNAVRACLNVGPSDRVCIVRNLPRREIAEAIAEESRSTGAEVRAWTMEDYGPRPLVHFPAPMAAEIREFRPTVSFFIGTGQKGELAFRHAMRGFLVDELHCRHGHMIGIDDLLMADGMAGDYDEVYRVTRSVYEIVRHARTITVETPLGTELTATFSPDRRWIPSDGRYWNQGEWGNLPEGETFTSPLGVEGLLVAEELGDWFAEKYRVISPGIRMHIKEGRLTGFETPDAALAADLSDYLATDENSKRVGEFAIGTNIGLTRIVGNFLQDEKFPGVHIAFGDPYGEETNADWSCASHVDALASHATVTVDGRTIMEAGRILV